MSVDIRPLIGLPPEATFRAFRARDELRLTTKWHEMWQEDHARAFTVAKVARLDLLDTIRNSLADVVANGGTVEQWMDRLIPDLQRAGWWGRVEDKSLTGTSAPVFVGPRRLENIFRINMRVSRAAGQWARIQDRKDVAPYLAYHALDDGHARPLHALWGGLVPGTRRIILHVDDPAWEWLFPPNDWGCRCFVTQHTEDDLRRRGWVVSPSPGKGAERQVWRAGSPTPELVPEGIGAGWAYNPGKASMRAIADKAAASLETAAGADLAGARAAVRELVDSPAFLQTLAQPGAAFPVMVLDDDVRAQISASGRVAMLSSETFAKQQRNHPELIPDDYRRLPDIGAAPDLIFQQDDRRLILMRTADGRWMKAVVKVTADGGEMFVTSLQYARAAEIARLRRRFKLIFGQIVGALAALIAGDVAADEAADAGAEA